MTKTEHPILFNGDMVRAIIDGRKTQTRQLIKPQPHPDFLARGVVEIRPQWPLQDGVRWFMEDGCSELRACPYGGPGDTLWLRETWAPDRLWKPGETITEPERVIYRADESRRRVDHCYVGRWRPSIHMPRWASRLTLEITGVRVERVHDIDGMDALAEGVLIPDGGSYDERLPQYREAFRELWDSTYAKKGFGWDTNPWVWVIDFKKQDQQ